MENAPRKLSDEERAAIDEIYAEEMDQPWPLNEAITEDDWWKRLTEIDEWLDKNPKNIKEARELINDYTAWCNRKIFMLSNKVVTREDVEDMQAKHKEFMDYAKSEYPDLFDTQPSAEEIRLNEYINDLHVTRQFIAALKTCQKPRDVWEAYAKVLMAHRWQEQKKTYASARFLHAFEPFLPDGMKPDSVRKTIDNNMAKTTR